MSALSYIIRNTVRIDSTSFARAFFDKNFLENWIDLSELMAKYPTQIQLQGAVVSFDGPVDGTVVILKSISALKTAIIAIYAIGLAMLTYFATELLLTTLADNKISIFDGMDAGTIQTISLVAAAVIGVGTGGLVYAFDALPFDLKFGAYGLA